MRIPGIALAGFCAGAVTGLFGGAGGMILVPMLTMLTDLDETEIFPASISIILPICLVCLMYCAFSGTLDAAAAVPYCIGSAVGGIGAGLWGSKISTSWLHRSLGALIIWGGIRYLW